MYGRCLRIRIQTFSQFKLSYNRADSVSSVHNYKGTSLLYLGEACSKEQMCVLK